MIRFISLIVLYSTILSVAGQSQNQLSKLDWLIGKWTRENVKEGRTAYEVWEKSSDTEFKGIGYSLRGADTVFVERLRIIAKEGSLYYVADVTENPNPVHFKFTSMDETSFVCENPEHDFPKKIDYTLIDGKMTARISGNGRSFDFIFSKK